MGKKDGLTIFELFRSPDKSATAEATPPPMPAVQKSATQVMRAAPAPVAPAAPRESSIASSPKTGPGDTQISMKLNTALFGLMIGAASLFGTFALGVQYERRHHPATPAPEENQVAAADPQPAPIPIAREPRRETPPAPAQPAGGEPRVAQPPPVEAKKGYTLQLMGYGSDQESTAQTMLRKVKEGGGVEATIVRDKTNGFIVVAGFVEKQTGAESEALLAKYRNLANRLNKPFNLNWIGATR
ncbi:MAG: hypothetical protein K8T20_14370 [Planctomycetes bacterium]|nr:hypothetical protein [Planctomycetota bacterium]